MGEGAVNVMTWPQYPRKRDPGPILQEAGWVLGLTWIRREKFAATGLRTWDHPTCSESLYQVGCPSHILI